MASVFQFALVARDGDVVVEYPPGNAANHDTTTKILQHLDHSVPFSVIEQQQVMVTVAVGANGLTFACLCDKRVETRRVGLFLNALKRKWMETYGATSEAAEAGPGSHDFGLQIKELLDHYNALVPVMKSDDSDDIPAESGLIIEETPNVVAEHDPELPVEFHADGESVARLRCRIFWDRNKRHVFVFLGLFIWIYIVLAFYCGDATLGKCFI